MKQETITKKQETNNYRKQPVVVVGTGMTTFGNCGERVWKAWLRQQWLRRSIKQG
jgi:hypothetical protein